MNPSEATSSREPVEELAESFLARYRHGARPSLTEYVAAHPDLADEIRDLFPALVEMEGLKCEPGEPTGLHGPTARGPGATPTWLGDYRILRMIGRGGMGVVYEAIQEMRSSVRGNASLPPVTLARPDD
jgi:hypothetical protein